MTDLSTAAIKQKIQALVEAGKMSRAGIARAAGLHANSLRDCSEEGWNPTADTLEKLAAFLRANDD
ncbi:hypothetical protein ACSTHX_00215, partial [Vibrio parahaemolyticus]